jgi:hypothetical protein
MTRFKQPSTPYQPTVTYAIGKGRGGVVLGELGKEHLERFCELLNSTEHPELKDHLRQLVEVWQDSGPNLKKMMSGPVEMMSETVSHTFSSAYEILKSLFTTSWAPTRWGRANLYVVTNDTELERLFGGERIYRNMPDGTRTLIPAVESWVEFGFFTLNPYCEEVAGPCARCRNYYVKKRKSQKVYCSRLCGNTAAALVRTAEARKVEHKQKMIRAKALIRKWNTLKSRSGLVWKVWLREHEPSITDKFVTRWVNMGELPEPKAGRKP